jgi:hypothetical protein
MPELPVWYFRRYIPHLPAAREIVHCVFSRLLGVPSATMVASRGFSGSTIRLIVPPLPAASTSLEEQDAAVLDPVLHLHQL